MRADRLLSAIFLLQAHKRLSGRELARRLEVSERTVHRDMEALSTAGVPVFALRGSQGGWQLDEHWRTQVPGLSDAELSGLLLGQPQIAGGAQRAMDKLVAALPAGQRERAAAIRERLYVDTTAWRGSTENLACLPVVQDAIGRDRKLLIRYLRAGRPVQERMVDPLGLVAKGVSWYLVAGTDRGIRTFRVSRIEQAALMEAACERPAHFDLGEYWRSSAKEFQESWPKFTVIVRLDAETVRSAQAWQVIVPIEDGLYRIEFGCENEACFVMLGLGPRVDVIEPASLRARVAAEHLEARRPLGAALKES